VGIEPGASQLVTGMMDPVSQVVRKMVDSNTALLPPDMFLVAVLVADTLAGRTAGVDIHRADMAAAEAGKLVVIADL